MLHTPVKYMPEKEGYCNGICKKTWKDRLVEYAGRRKITNVSTLAAQIVDMERAEGVVSEEGSPFNAASMNDLEQRAADAFSAVQQDIEGINSDLASGQIEFSFQDGKGVYRKKVLIHGSLLNRNPLQ